MTNSELFIIVSDISKKQNWCSIIAKRKDLLEVRAQIIKATSFLHHDAQWKERCTHILQSKYELNKCACGCDTTISIFNRYVKNHNCKDDETKNKWKEKLKTTMLTKYGPEYGQYRLLKAKATNIKKYGVEYSTQTEQMKQKSTETMLSRYGVANCSSSDIIKQKKRNTYISNYGCEFNKSPIVNDKIRKSRHKETYNRFFRFSDIVKPDFSVSDFNGGGYDKQYSWLCTICGDKFDSYYHNGTIPRCLVCNPLHQYSIAQQEIYDFLSTIYKGKIINNDRNAIAPIELDIYIPELNLAIEYNGLYWHSESKGKDKNYHIKKTNLCKSVGIKLIHIFEDEWQNKQHIVKSKLSNMIIKNENRYYARNTSIVSLSNIEKKEFFHNNHIQGNDKSSICYGLKYKNEIIAVMSFSKSRYNFNFEYELVRYATLLNSTVVGGASKLLKYFIKKHEPTTIISYADLRWTTTNNLYDKLGFVLSHTSQPNYYYFKGLYRESRLKYQKHKLKNILSTYNDSLSESENMKLAGYEKIWDCGNLVYSLHL